MKNASSDSARVVGRDSQGDRDLIRGSKTDATDLLGEGEGVRANSLNDLDSVLYEDLVADSGGDPQPLEKDERLSRLDIALNPLNDRGGPLFANPGNFAYALWLLLDDFENVSAKMLYESLSQLGTDIGHASEIGLNPFGCGWEDLLE